MLSNVYAVVRDLHTAYYSHDISVSVFVSILGAHFQLLGCSIRIFVCILIFPFSS